jgi:hypothetical protein
MSVLIVDDHVISSIVSRIEDSQKVSDSLTYLCKDLLFYLVDNAPEWENEYQYLAYKMYKMNVRTYDNRYNAPFEVVRFTYKPVPLCSDIQLVKYLDCWLYNSDYLPSCSFFKLIDELRINLMKHIVRNLPEYLNANYSE